MRALIVIDLPPLFVLVPAPLASALAVWPGKSDISSGCGQPPFFPFVPWPQSLHRLQNKARLVFTRRHHVIAGRKGSGGFSQCSSSNSRQAAVH
jgi:hypothetical protein